MRTLEQKSKTTVIHLSMTVSNYNDIMKIRNEKNFPARCYKTKTDKTIQKRFAHHGTQ
jgi:hypothetical protein